MPETRKWNTLGLYRKFCRETDWTEDDTALLEQIITIKPYLYLDEISEMIGLQTGRWWSASWLWERIRNDLNMTLQAISLVAGERNEEERARYDESIRAFVHRPDQVVFLDETHKGRNASRRRRHWSMRGVRPIVYEKFDTVSRGRLYSMVAACDYNGFIIETCLCLSREKDADGRMKTIDSEIFLDWLEDYLVPVLGKYESLAPRSIVVLDNASIHHSDEVMDVIEEAGAKILYTAPYSPDKNPIEYMFAQYKAALKRNDGNSWEETHMLALMCVSPSHARNYFRHCGIPGCENFSSEEEEAEMLVAAASLVYTATVASVATLI